MSVREGEGVAGRRTSGLGQLFSRRSPQSLLVLGFAALILLGALLLLLPISHVAGRVGPLDALFTSTSAVCVTGLVVVDTAGDFTMFGQVVILILIQAGGLGVMTFAALLFRILGRRMSLSTQAALHDSFFQRDTASEFASVFRRILAMVVGLEAAGALVIFLSLRTTETVGRAAYSAVFHSISAFCNAGFSIYSKNLVEVRDNPVMLATIMALIIAGGLGHVVLRELWERVAGQVDGWRHGRGRANSGAGGRLSYHARVVLLFTTLLVVGGTVFIFLFGLTGEEPTLGGRVWHSLFQSVTARTAGFNSVNIAALPVATLVLLSVLMFVGGSPAGCAGGVKTTSLAVYFAQLRALLGRNSEPKLLGRSISSDTIQRVGRVFVLAATWNLLGIILLSATEAGPLGVNLEHVVFEQMSAFGTVGLSANVTPQLSAFGRLWIIATMFVGRLGPLTLATWVASGRAPRVRHPEGRLMIG